MYILCTESPYEPVIKCFLFLQESSFGVEHYVTAEKIRMTTLLLRPIFVLLTQKNSAFIQTIALLPGCQKFRSFSCSLQHSNRHWKDNPYAPLSKSEIQFAIKVKETRKRLNISQKEVAEAIGMSRTRVSEFETLQLPPAIWRQWKPWMENWICHSQENASKKSSINAPLLEREIEFVTELKQTRAKLNVSQREVAEAIGASGWSVTSFELLKMCPATWRKLQVKIKLWMANPNVSQDYKVKAPDVLVKDTINRQKVCLETYFEKDRLPSRQMFTQISQETGLEEKSVRNWFRVQNWQKTWISTKLADPNYEKSVDESVKKAIVFAKEFEKTRKDLGQSLSDVARSPYWPYCSSQIGKFEKLQVSEDQLVNYHQILERWMLNLPEPKESAKNRVLLDKHMDYLEQVLFWEGNPSKEKLKEITETTGISYNSLVQWLNRRKRKSLS